MINGVPQVGDRMTARPTLGDHACDIESMPLRSATVIAVNEERCMATVEFDMGEGKSCRETFFYGPKAIRRKA